MTDPYYTDELVTLYHGNCIDITAWRAADILVTDPPYGIAFQSGSRKGPKLPKITGDHNTLIRDAMLALWGHDRPALVFGHWSAPPPATERMRLIWWKEGAGPGMGDLTMPWGTSHEDIHLLGTGWNREATGVPREGSVIATHESRSAHAERTRHPTSKPVGLMEHLITRCPPGAIADPFAGSGATLLAARNLGRHAIGIELDEAYCETIATRLAQHVLTTPREPIPAYDQPPLA